MILANPPYVSGPEMKSLEPDLSYEPRQALDAGADGLMIIKPLIEQAPRWLKPHGIILLEIGSAQGPRVRDILGSFGFTKISIRKDHSGHDRLAEGLFL
jgi:release factor glutamine methyltransferase